MYNKIRNLFQQFISGYSFESSCTIHKNHRELYEYIKNTDNWHRVDFHELIYIHNDWEVSIINTKFGRGVFRMQTDDKLMQIRYSIEYFAEGTWKFLIKILPDQDGAKLLFECNSPLGIPSATFKGRASSFASQLNRLREYFSTSRNKIQSAHEHL